MTNKITITTNKRTLEFEGKNLFLYRYYYFHVNIYEWSSWYKLPKLKHSIYFQFGEIILRIDYE